MGKLASWLSLVLVCLLALSAQAQVAVISGQVINQYGQPLPNALIRVCSVTSTGVPCTPTASIYQDYALTIPAANPWTTDSYGNYALYVGPTTSPNLYTVQQSPDSGITWSYVFNGPSVIKYSSGPVNSIQASDGNSGFISDSSIILNTSTHSFYAPSINGEVYPARCGSASPPGWCSGTTADAWIRAACSQLPSTGGIINLLGLTGTLAASVPCSTPTKQVGIVTDSSSPLTITENDGGTTFPIDNGSWIVGQAGGSPGNCPNANGIHLSSSANITAVVGPAHTDGSQESMVASGLCITGAAGATVSQALIFADRVYANTIFEGNVLGVCNTACMKALNTGEINLVNNWFNVENGVTTITGIPLIIQGTGLGNGCNIGPVDVSGGQIEHALGGSNYPEILVEGDGSGLVLACDIHIHNLGIERSPGGIPGTIGIDMRDCKNCSVENVVATGNSGSSQSMIKLTANSANSIANVVLRSISNIYGTYTNTLNDTTSTSSIPGGLLPFSAQSFITAYYANPGYVQAPVLPLSTLQSVGSDAMAGAGNFNTGSSTIGTGFVQTGCNVSVTCTYTRTNSTAPPGLTYSQQIQITANSDTSEGYNGVQYGTTTPVSFTAGVSYIGSFWAKSDGTFVGYPAFLLWNSLVPTFYCQNVGTSALTSTWAAYSFVCTPATSGSSNIAIAAATPSGNTGTFWLAGFTFAPISAFSPGVLLTSVGPYSIGPASTAQQSIIINGTNCTLQGSCTVYSGATGTYAYPTSVTTANGIVTSVTAGSAPRTIQTKAITTGICTTSTTAFSTCTFSMTWPASFASTSYVTSCQPFVPTSGSSTATVMVYVVSKTTTGMTIELQNSDGTSAGATTLSELDCTGIL